MTARMLAWKQPLIQRVRNSSLVERPCVDNKRASSVPPKLRILPQGDLVGEHSMAGEFGARAPVEGMEKQM